MHWPECYGEIRYAPSRELVWEDPSEYAPENEAGWRGDAPTWPIADFFEVLKDQYRELNFTPTGSRSVFGVYTTFGPNLDGMVEMLRGIYQFTANMAGRT